MFRRYMCMTCPGCGAAMHIDSRRECLLCDFCGGFHIPEANSDGVRLLGDPTAFRCPVCSDALVEASLAGYGILYCRECGGIQSGMEAFVSLIAVLRSERGSFAAVPRPIDLKLLERRLQCPQCHEAMYTDVYGGPGNIVIDSCERCAAVWLDRGELTRIVSSPDREYASLEIGR